MTCANPRCGDRLCITEDVAEGVCWRCRMTIDPKRLRVYVDARRIQEKIDGERDEKPRIVPE